MDHPMQRQNLWYAPSVHRLPPFALVIGILTPYAAALAGCLEFWGSVREANVDLFHLIAAIVVSLSLGVLAPGAYSVDNKIFDIRLVNLPNGSEGNPSDIEEVE
jgi:uncharacterized membrane protein YphA (DoxX/SURF4 family)